ncbi:telomeric repeat-binding factor 2-interacting protein 1 isoform X2 [Hippocampus zosterae]|uniref:telomeric repeat-binding factor 2-interacting protein 1 isoform X2 n=1 Tax=Hippocampus zosterae TaxID=109293 RepID=UPI00223E2B6E|nr:telomeric repeat-binding factor 2-interacting protein 1 isoform X2 [Hippocampus zosterae]
MMASKGQDITQCNISPVLFMTVEGEPMSFYLRPGPIKKELQPLITAGGGTMCNVQKPGSILLIDPEEKGAVNEGTAHRYVSMQYIHDCVEKDEQLNLDDYRMKAGTGPNHSPKFNEGNRMSPGNSGGRQAYNPSEDAAILKYVHLRKSEVKGNRLWQQMEKERVTTHSWQSMKARYKDHLVHKHTEDVGVEEAAGEDAQDNEKAEATDRLNFEDEAAVPQVDSKPKDPPSPNSGDGQTQIDLLPVAEKGSSGDAEAQTSNPLQQEEEIFTPPQDEIEPAMIAESEMCDSLESEESTKPETDQPPANTSPQSEKAPESTEQAQKEPHSEDLTSDDDVQPLCVRRRSVRRSVRKRLEESEEEEATYTRKLPSLTSSSSSKTSVRQLPSSPPTPIRTRSASSSLPEEAGEHEPPPKRAKGETEAAEEFETAAENEEAEIRQEDAVQSAAAPQAGPAHVNKPNVSEPPRAERKKKKKSRRKLGIIERAAKEFLSSSSSTSISSDSDSEHWDDPLGPRRITSPLTIPQSVEGMFETASETPLVEPLASVAVSPAQADPRLPEHQPGEWKTPPEGRLSPRPSSALGVASKARVGGKSLEKDVIPPERVQFEEDKRCIRELMKQTNQDLVSVVKALLMTSGDLSAASRLLSDPMSFCGPLWDRQDDRLLLSDDSAALQRLQRKHGEAAVAKRIMFLKVER